eukprot:3982430-Prymnesium_polylepis.1
MLLVERRHRGDADDGREASRAGDAEQDEIVSRTQLREVACVALVGCVEVRGVIERHRDGDAD